MGRISLPDESTEGAAGAGPSLRRRTVAVSTALVLSVAAGAVVLARGDMLPFRDSCDGDGTMELGVVASPDIAPALRRVADGARDGKVRTDGRCLDVKVTARPSYEVADKLNQGGSDPGYQVWVPDSSLWLQRAADSGEGVPLGESGNVAHSPLTLGAVPAAGAKLGWPDRKYGWAELTSAAEKENLRWGTADPARSATGLLALARIAGSARAEKESDADVRIAATAELLSERIADGDEQVLATLPRDDSGTEKGNPRRNQAVVVSEQAAHAYNTDDNGTDALELFYPEDGTAALDYPYVTVDDDRLTANQTRAAERFLTLLGTGTGRGALHDHGFRTDARTPPGVARAAGARAPQPYTAAPADPPSSGELRTVLGMWTITVQSARLTTVVDASASMSEPVPGRDGESRMDVTKASLLQALAGFTAEDEIGLWEFARRLDGNRDYREVVPTGRLGDSSPDGSTQRERLTAAFGALEPVPDGATGLYDTALAAYEDALETYASGKFNAVVLLTDGRNEDPESVSADDLVKKLEGLARPQRPVPLIAIAVGPDADRKACERIAEATGGSAHRVGDPAQIHSVILKAIVDAGRS